MSNALDAVELALVVARGAAAQQGALDRWLDARRAAADGRTCAVVAEGAFFALRGPAGVPLVPLTAGCVCCVGSVPLRVALLRLLRQARPQQVLLLLASDQHIDRVRQMLAHPSWGIEIRIV